MSFSVLEVANQQLTDLVASGLRIERPEASALHHLVEAHPRGAFVSQFMNGGPCVVGKTKEADVWGGEQVFLIGHDWSAALGTGDKRETDFRPPYDEQIFEFKISGRRVCVKVQAEPSGNVIAVCFVGLAAAWVMLPLYDLNRGIIPDTPPSLADLQWSSRFLSPIYDLVIPQIRGACVALDAEIATTSAIEPSPQLKKSRTASGRAAPYTFHVLQLARRTGRNNAALAEEPPPRVRLHFRRGHYRHFATGLKSWIKWTLVGNPDLGFIEKHYRF